MDKTSKRLQMYSEEMKQEVKRLNIPIESEIHKRIKVASAEQSKTVAQFVREAVLEKLERNKK